MPMDEKIEKYIHQCKSILASTLDPLCIVDKSNHIVYFNSLMQVFLEINSKELRESPKFCDLLKHEICSASCQIMEACVQKGEKIEHNCTLGKKNNQAVKLRMHVEPLYNLELNEKNEIMGAIIQIRDITAEETLGQKYKLLIRSAAEIVFKANELHNIKKDLIKIST